MLQTTRRPLVPAPGEPRVLRGGVRRRRLVFALLFAVATLVGRSGQADGAHLAVFWPAAAVGLLWVAGSAGRRGRVVDVLLLVATTAALRLVLDMPAPVTVLLAVAAGVQALAGAWTYRWLQPSGFRLTTPTHLRTLALAAGVGAAASSPLATLGFHFVQDVSTPLAGAQWFLRTAVSAFVVLAVVLRSAERRRRAPGSATSTAERFGLHAAFLTTYAGVFWFLPGAGLAFLALPVAVWTALRRTATAATVHVVLAAGLVVLSTWAGRGPWVQLDPDLQAMAGEAFIGTLGLVTLVLALYRDQSVDNATRAATAHAEAAEQADLLSVVVASISDAVSVVAADGTALLRNPAAQALLGPVRDRRTATTDRNTAFTLTRPDGSAYADHDLPVARGLRGEAVEREDVRMATPGGADPRLLTLSVHPLPTAAGGASWSGGIVAAFHDVTQVRAAAAQVARSRDLFAGVLAAATEHSIIAVDPGGRITVFNEGAERLLGWTAQEVLGTDALVVHDPAELGALADRLGLADAHDLFSEVVAHAGPTTAQLTYVRKDGTRFPVNLTTSPMRDGDGTFAGFMAMATDITDRLVAERERDESEALFRTAFDTAPVGIVMVAAEGPDAGRVVRVNRSMRRFTGLSQEDLVGMQFADLAPADAAADLALAFAPLLLGEAVEHGAQVRLAHADGRVLEAEISSTLLRPNGSEALVLCVVEDVTARLAAERELSHQVLHDGLTGLPNRELFLDRLEHARAAAARTRSQVGLLFIDLDGFKAVNDTAGHVAGDQLLQQVAAVLSGVVRPGDTVARLGGDEFAVVCPQTGAADTLVIAERILAAIDRPFRVDGFEANVGASIGARSCDGTGTTEQMLRDADEAMYRAKREGKGRVAVHGEPSAGRRVQVAHLVEPVA